MNDRPIVIVVDDERDILIALEDLLDEHYRVLTFQEPAQALEHLASAPEVAVLVSDQRMPSMPGHRFIAAARQRSAAEAILLTGYADMDAVIAAINEGRITGYVHKPWDAANLLNMVRLAAERYEMRRALDRERELFRALLAGAAGEVRLIDAEGAVLRSNREDATARLADPGDQEALRSGVAWSEELAAGDGWRRVERLPITVGGERMLLRFDNDISRERALEDRLRQAEKLEALGTLAGGIAHDFNNLLTAVIGNLELALRKPDAPAVPRFLGGALDAARRGATLTARLLSFSRQRGVVSRVVSVGRLIAGMTDLLERTLGGGIAIAISGCEADLHVRADPDQLELAILNLCVNARDAMAANGTITISCAVVPQSDDGSEPTVPLVKISVIDTGTGMDDSVRQRVFEPFFTTKPVGKGTGLGLSMVYGFVTGLGGRVEIESAPGQGSTISILLPQAEQEEEPAAEPKAEKGVTDLAILLVEDDGGVRDVTRRHLEDMGHRVASADGARAALAMIDAGEALDLLVTDFAMPGGSGLELVEEARRRRPGVPVLLLTGYAEGGALPADVAHLAKPYSPDDLAKAIGAMMRRR